MAESLLWRVVLVSPGESEVSLLQNLSSRGDAKIVAVVDPDGQAVGTAIAEVMGIPIVQDLNDPVVEQAGYLVYPVGYRLAQFLGRQAVAIGLRPMSSSELQIKMSRDLLTRRVAGQPPESFTTIEREMEAIHRTLSRIEEVLQRESLLRWLLSLATRAVKATSGSILLFDEKAQELYIAFAYGLSEATQHSTRIQLGEGIAGRVAKLKRSELVCGRQQATPELAGDRPDIAAAISSPLLWEDRLLGVLNVSVSEGDPPLTEEDLATIDRLARRISLILDRFLELQRAQTSELFHQVDGGLQDLMWQTDDMETILAAWAGTLTLALEAASCSLAVICDDGSLLVAEGGEGGETRVWYETMDNPAWNEVRQTGAPLVVREADPTARESGGLTVYYLPVGGDTVQGIMTAVFTTASEAHRFHAISGDILYLLERRLAELVRRITQHDRTSRLSALSTALTEIAAAGTDVYAREKLIQGSAARLTGADMVYVVMGLSGDTVQLSREAAGASEPWLRNAGRLLREAGEDGWRVTLFSDGSDPRLQETCIMAVPTPGDDQGQGLILRGKRRMHFLDGGTFTQFDARLVQHLATMLTVPATVLDTESPSESEAAILTGSSAPAPPVVPSNQREVVLDLLTREMDRCDRYHTTFALTAFRPCVATWDQEAARRLADQLAQRVRSSDHITCLEDGTLLVVVPEDIQAIPRQQRRLVTLMRELTGVADLQVATSHGIYPGRYESSHRLLDEILASLE